MIYRWAIIDRNGVETSIPEPVNGDSVSVSFTRNMTSHGIITSINTGSLAYYEDAYDLLKAEYDAHGADGRMELKIEYICDGTVYDFFRGKFDFNTYKRECGDLCVINCDVINQRCSDIFMTRLEQDVNIDAVFDMDGNAITPIVSDDVVLDGQDIPLTNLAVNDTGADRNYLNLPSTLTGTKYWYMPVYLPKLVLNEFNDFAMNANPADVVNTPNNDAIDFNIYDEYLQYGQFLNIWENTQDPLNCVDTDATINYRVKGVFSTLAGFDGTLTTRLILAKYDLETRTLASIDAQDIGVNARAITQNVQDNAAFDISYSNTPAYKPESEVLVFYILVIFFKTTASGGVDLVSYGVNYDPVTSFRMDLISQCDATETKSYRLDRVYEWLNKPYVGEDCFDVQVTADTTTSCFDSYHLTNGLNIRRVNEPNPPQLFLNWNQLFKATRCMFNHGWGFTANETTLLVGDVETFYQGADVIDLGSIRNVQFTTAKDLIYGVIDIGYNKWEAEEYTGLDEMNTARQYRRNVQNSQVILDLMCDIITAGYTIEITRRKNQAKTGTSDWRYDNDLFLINTILQNGDYHAVRGVDSGALNILSPATRMNYRLTPARMMLNWFKSVSAARPTWQSETIDFSSGTGNYRAKGKMNGCSPESVAIFEDQSFDKDDIVTGQAEPIWETIIASFDAPMTMVQYEALLANPYGRVAFSCGATNYEGWIVTLELRPKDGLADVKLLIAR
jgi:hypothetical protein